MGIVTLQMKHNISLIYLQNDGFWHQFNPLFHGSPLLSNSSLMKASYHVWMMSKSQKSRKSFIHGSHGGHGKRFSLKIILKIFVKIYTIGYFCRDSAKNKFLDLFSALTAPKIRAVRRSIINPSPKARCSSAFSVRIFVKDYIFSCLSARCFGVAKTEWETRLSLCWVTTKQNIGKSWRKSSCKI